MTITNRFRKAMTLIALLASLGCAHSSVQPTNDPLRIYLARHGQTSWNLERRYQGQTDTELNETGMEQARELAARIAGLEIEVVYSSALRRSRETALIAAGNTIAVESLPTLNEQALGKFEGLYVDGRDPAGVAEYERRSSDPADSLDGGESSDQMFARVCNAAQSIQNRHPAGNILIVGHGGTNAMILRCLFSLSAEEGEAIRQANDEIYLIEVYKERPILWKLISKKNLGDL